MAFLMMLVFAALAIVGCVLSWHIALVIVCSVMALICLIIVLVRHPNGVGTSLLESLDDVIPDDMDIFDIDFDD